MSRQALRGAPWWSLAEIEADVAQSRQEFRRRRLGEPLQRYLSAFDLAEPDVVRMVSKLEDMLAGGAGTEADLRALWSSDSGRTAFRYLGAPPISDDDLETLAELRLAASSADPVADYGEKLLAVMRVIVDPRRYPLDSGSAQSQSKRAQSGDFGDHRLDRLATHSNPAPWRRKGGRGRCCQRSLGGHGLGPRHCPHGAGCAKAGD